LSWLGLSFDEVYRQSDRHQLYNSAIEALKTSGRLYPCFETPEELSFKRKRQLSRGQPPIYDRAALRLTADEQCLYEKEGRKAHWRLKLEPGKVSWVDLVHGEIEFEGEKLSDPVLLREDGFPIYTLSSVVDDIDLKITHVIRGDDHISNTAVQIQLMQALGANPKEFCFGHMPLLKDASGEGLSKRLGSLSISQLRNEGIQPMAINSLLATLGTSHSVRPFLTMQELTAHFDIREVNPGSSPKFAIEELHKLNSKLFHEMPFTMAVPHLKQHNLTHIDAAFWEVIRGNISGFEDLRLWWKVCYEEIVPVVEDPTFLSQALVCLPNKPWNNETWQQWTTALKAATGRKGKELFMPLRLALTGLPHGPEMQILLPMIGFERVSERLKGRQA
ncbi:MAG: glutamate--tRNA ligase, partial [Alphaproteobacteria bacterium]|nr:glutamate--tRNA ligase [Alphaproteobacteria bacterium]